MHGGALVLLCAVIQQRHTGIFKPQNLFRVQAAHVGKLHQLVGHALGVGAGIDEDKASVDVGHTGSQAGSADTLDASHQQGGPGEQSAGGAGGDHCVPFPALEHIQRHHHGSILLPADGCGGLIVHVDDVPCMADGDPGQVLCPLVLQTGSDRILPAHQNDLVAKGLVRLNGALYDLMRGVVAAHCVNDDSHT